MTEEVQGTPCPPKKIPLMECFGPTYQGEGAFAGTQSYFLRFGLCDSACIMCDSMHSVDPEQVSQNARWLTQEQILTEFLTLVSANKNNCQMVTFSGGNPCIHDLTWLVQELNKVGIMINVETQGTKNPKWLGDMQFVTISPKSPGMGEMYSKEHLSQMIKDLDAKGVPHCLKIVVFSEQDFEFASAVFAEYPGSPKYLSQGNLYIPGALVAEDMSDDEIRIALLHEYRALMEDLLKRPDLHHATFLPQLHVLAWANLQEV